jgi:hypothetical protein
MPEECQSIPITAPNAWNQKGSARRRSTSVRPYSCAIASTITLPSRAIRDDSQAGTRPPCSGRSAEPVATGMRGAWHGLHLKCQIATSRSEASEMANFFASGT